METAAALLAALLALAPGIARTSAVQARRERIASHAAAAESERGVPSGVLLVIGLLESAWGTARGSGGSWGAPVSASRRGVAGTPDRAAAILARGFERCGTWRGSVTFFRTGRCRFARTLVGYEPSDALRWIERAYDRAGVPLPDRLR